MSTYNFRIKNMPAPASLPVHFTSCLLKHQAIVTSHSPNEITFKSTFGNPVGVRFGVLHNEYALLYKIIQYCCRTYLDDGLGV